MINFLIELIRRDGIAHVSKTVQTALGRSEWVRSAPKETSDGRTLVGHDKSLVDTR